MPIERLICDCIERKKGGCAVRVLLKAISLIFRLGAFLYHVLYDLGIRRQEKVPAFVVSIGNIVAGGTGKTPFVLYLANKLADRAQELAILSRGYRGKGTGKMPSLIAIDKEGGAEIYGDEAFLLAKKLGCPVWVGKNRVESAYRAISAGARMLLLDDGFQHRKLYRDVDLVLLDGTDLFGKGSFLPSGYLRDFPKRLAQADMIILTRLECIHGDKDGLVQAIHQYTKAPIVGFSSTFTCDCPIKGEKVAAFCGIAKPELFYHALEVLGAQIVNRLSVSDHRLPELSSLTEFAIQSRAQGAQWILCTEKDFVKISQEILERVCLPIFPVRMELSCTWNENSWKEMLSSLQNRKK